MLVLPMSLTLGVLLPVGRRGWWVGDFRDKECCRGLGDSVDEHAQQRDLEKHKEADAETKQDSFAVSEPGTLLLWCVMDALEIRIQLDRVSSV